MKKVDIYLDGKRLDIDEDVEVVNSFSANKLQELSSASGNTSIEIQLPITSTNLAAIKHSHNINEASDFSSVDLLVQVYENGILNIRGSGLITETSDYIGLVIFSGNSDWVSLLGDKLLSEINFSDLNHTFEVPTVEANRNNSNGFVYPNCYYGAFVDNSRPYDLSDFYPAIYYKEYLQRIFQDIGFTVDGDILTDQLFLKSILPFANDKMYTPASANNPLFLTSTSTIDLAGEVLTNVIGATQYMGLTNPVTDRIDLIQAGPKSGFASSAGKFISKQQTSYRFKFALNFTAVGGSGAFAIEFVEVATSTVKASVSVPYVAGSNSRTVELFTSDSPEVFGQYAFRLFGFLPTGHEINLVNGTVEVLTHENFWYGQNTMPGEQVILSQAIPQGIKQADFLKHIINQFGLIVTTDPIRKTVFFDMFKNIASNKILDATNLVDNSTRPKITNSLGDYARRNWLRYAEDNNDQLLVALGNFADDYFEIAKENLPSEGNVFESEFAPVGRNPQASVSTIFARPARKPVARCAYVDTTTSVISMFGQSPQATNKTIRFDEMKFGNLIANYLQKIVFAINKQKVLTLFLKLTQAHIKSIVENDKNNFSFNNLLYINTTVKGVSVVGLFYILEIKQYNSMVDESTEVDLVLIE